MASCSFPIEAAVTSLRPDVVLFSRPSKTIVFLELTLPLEDNVHLAHERKTSKYSALVTACEENGFKGAVSRYSVIFLRFFPRPKKWRTARANVADIKTTTGQSAAQNNFTAEAKYSKCRFRGAIVVFRGLALWLPLFFPHTKMAAKNHRFIVTLPL